MVAVWLLVCFLEEEVPDGFFRGNSRVPSGGQTKTKAPTNFGKVCLQHQLGGVLTLSCLTGKGTLQILMIFFFA